MISSRDMELCQNLLQNGSSKIQKIVADKLILSYLPLGYSLVSRYRSNRKDYDILVSIMFEALVKGVHRLKRQRHISVSGYLATTISGSIKNYFREESRYRNKIKDLIDMRDGFALEEEDLANREILNAGLMDDRDRKILNLRLQDYTDEEIAGSLGLSRQRVQQIWSLIVDRIRTK